MQLSLTRSPDALPRPPESRGVPFVGNIRSMLTDPCAFLTTQYLRHGPIFSVLVMGRRLLVFAGPEANALFKKQGHCLFTSRDSMKGVRETLGTDNPTLIELDGAAHRTMRGGLKAGYSAITLYRQMPKLVDHQLRLIARWPRGQPFSVVPQVKRLVSSLLGYIATSRSADGVMDDLIYFLRALLEIHVLRVRPYFMKYLPAYARSKRAVQDMGRDIWSERTSDRLAEPHPGPIQDRDFVDVVQSIHTTHPELMSEKDASAAIIGPFLAGLDTAATTISFLLFQILKDPSLKRAVIAEADTAFASGVPDRAALRQMVTTRYAAMEVLRMYPPAFALARTTATEFSFRGYRVSAGEECLIAHTVTHFLPEFFPHPEVFDIERYAPPRSEHIRGNAYLPYGLGAHTCLGASIADLLYLIVTAMLFHHFEVEVWPPGRPLHTVMKPLRSPDDQFKVVITAARSQGRAKGFVPPQSK